jgi:CheY-like chemotaxis protein
MRIPATDRLPRLEAAPLEPRALRTRKERARVLVVDDEKAIRSTTVLLLEELGYDATQAASGREALQRIEVDGPIDVALLDMTMPGETGLQVLDALRAKTPGLPGVLMSGYSEDLLRTSPPDGVPFLKKPFRPSELAERLQEALAGGRRAPPARV